VRAGVAGITGDYELPRIWPESISDEDFDSLGQLPGTLDDALEALTKDDVVRAWFDPFLLETYESVKRAELEMTRGLDDRDLCSRYADVY
jgi:glutamine synthetase